ncbi:MAG: ATP-binding cassette domain-containing protein [Bacteroidales bacterium]|nr:ATP-binding cassette domain-containing protein [Bacteroidales bacterium]
MIEVIGLNKTFGNKHVLQGIDFTINKGMCNLVIGQSGSGKSVFLKSVVGLHPVDQGQILYDGRDLTKLKHNQLKALRKEIGMVFQGGALFNSSTVEENIKYPMDVFTKWSKKEKQDRIDFCLDRVNIQNSNHLYPSEISGGMQKRVAIARAIALNPKYLFFDEPNSGLDPVTAIVIDDLIQEITKEFNITTMVITHDMNSVMEIGENIMFVYQGNKWWEGNKSMIFKTDNTELNNFVFASDLFKAIKTQVS